MLRAEESKESVCTSSLEIILTSAINESKILTSRHDPRPVPASTEPALVRGASVTCGAKERLHSSVESHRHVSRVASTIRHFLALLIPPSVKFPVFSYLLSIQLKQNLAFFLRGLVDGDATHSIVEGFDG